MDSALDIEYAYELERFIPGEVLINKQKYLVLTGYEGTGRCFWCGSELNGKTKRYCRGHMQEYYRHFYWPYASNWAIKRADRKCQNCGVKIKSIPYGYSGHRVNLEVHHIIPLNGDRRDFSAFNLPWNLIVLCHDCHMELHAVMRPPKEPGKGFDSWDDAIKAGQAIMKLEFESRGSH